jgi:hypothetical protein
VSFVIYDQQDIAYHLQAYVAQDILNSPSCIMFIAPLIAVNNIKPADDGKRDALDIIIGASNLLKCLTKEKPTVISGSDTTANLRIISALFGHVFGGSVTTF